MSAVATFGRLNGIDRPALATIIPTRQNPAVLLDSGASVECRPQHLVQFARMGAAYARIAIGCALLLFAAVSGVLASALFPAPPNATVWRLQRRNAALTGTLDTLKVEFCRDTHHDFVLTNCPR